MHTGLDSRTENMVNEVEQLQGVGLEAGSMTDDPRPCQCDRCSDECTLWVIDRDGKSLYLCPTCALEILDNKKTNDC